MCNAYFQADFVIEVVDSQHSLVLSPQTTLDKEGMNDILTFSSVPCLRFLPLGSHFKFFHFNTFKTKLKDMILFCV